MENILQSLVKIIIIGALYENANVDGNRQFLASPPLPYYQNEDYYVPGFAPPLYYPERKASPPVSYQNLNSYSPPQLFYQNENYIPPPAATPGLRRPSPHLFPHKHPFPQSSKPQHKLNFGFARVEYRKPPLPKPSRPHDVPLKKTEAFASNIIVKEEPLTPYYHDDYGKNYDEDYSDSYSDESPTLPKPCLPSSPYRHFQSPQATPSSGEKFTLCSPYFQPNFGNSLYTLKVPITLLPSRFPPRVEQLIERIQNYFSTYTQQQALKPHNETSPAPPPPPHTTTPTPSQSPAQLSATQLPEKNKTEEETSSQGATPGEVEPVTQKTVVVAVETKEPEAASTTAPDAQQMSEPQTAPAAAPGDQQMSEPQTFPAAAPGDQQVREPQTASAVAPDGQQTEGLQTASAAVTSAQETREPQTASEVAPGVQQTGEVQTASAAMTSVQQTEAQTAEQTTARVEEAVAGAEGVQGAVQEGAVAVVSPEGGVASGGTQLGEGKAESVVSAPAEDATKAKESSNDHMNDSFHDVTNTNG